MRELTVVGGAYKSKGLIFRIVPYFRKFANAGL